MKPVIMISHRYGGRQDSLDAAAFCRDWLVANWPGAAWVAPWIEWARAVGHEVEADPAQRAEWVAKSCRVARQCDGVLVIGSISPGVAQEFMAARSVAAIPSLGMLRDMQALTFAARRPGVRWDLDRDAGVLR